MPDLRISFLFCLIVYGFSSCKPEIPSVEVNADLEVLYRKNGLQFASGKLFSGYIVEKSSNGTIHSKQGFLNGKAEGVATRFYENGKIQELRYFTANHKTGKHEGFYPDGSLKFEYYFENDLPVGVHKEFYENGQLFALSTFNSVGQPEGLQQQFFESGKVKANYTLKNGRRYGLMGAKGCMGENEKVATNFQPAK